MNRRITEIISVLFCLCLMAAAGMAQNVTFRGQVVDERGDTIPNAEVTLIGKDGKERKGKSTFTGEVTIANVPPGAYKLTASYAGFQTQVIEEVKVPTGAPLVINLAIAAVEVITDVSVNNQAVSVEPDQNMNATVLGDEFIKSLPDNEDDLRDYLNALVGPTAAGGNGQGADIIVDGFSGGRLPPKEAIMQIRINQNPYSAEFSSPGFGRVEIVTKPGNDSWRGGAGWGYHNSGVDARNAFALTRPVVSLNRFDFNIGGPIIKKKMSATIFANRSNTDGESPTVARLLSGNFAANVPSQTINNFVGVRADYLLNNTNTLNISYNFRTGDSINQEFAVRLGGGFGGFGPGGGGGGGGFGGGGGGFGGGGGSSNLLPERASNRENSNHNLRLSETWIINSKTIHEARFQYERDRSDQIALTNALAINVLDSFSGGGSTCCPNTARQDSFEYQDYLTYTTKGAKHTIKGGIQMQYDRVSDVSGSNFNGTFTFSSLENYNLALNASTNPNAPQCTPGGNGQAPGITPCATQFTFTRGNTLLEYGAFRGSWFVGDDWRVSQNFTLSYGVRHEFQNYLGDKVNFAPRIGVAWSPFKSRKTTIRLGMGVFYERLRAQQIETALRVNGVLQQNFIVRNAIFKPTLAETLTANANLITQVANNTTRPLDPNLKAPYDINTSLVVEQQLPKGLVGTFTYLAGRGINQFRTRNINAPFRDPNNPTQFIRPDPTQGIVLMTESSARNESNRLTFGMSRRMGRVITFGGYTLSWLKSNGEGTPANNYDLSTEWGRSSGDIRHNYFQGFNMTLPKGFRVSGILNARSGSPFNITTGRDDNLDGTINDRPLDLNGQPIQRNSNLSPSLYSTAQFNRLICPPGSSCSGTTGLVLLRDFLQQNYADGVIAQGPGQFNVNLTLAKTFSFGKPRQSAQAGQGGQGGGGGRGGGGGGRGGGGGGMMGGMGGMRGGGGGGPMMMGFGGGENGRYSLTFQVAASNLFNRVNFNNYGGTLGSAFFGRSSSAGSARQLDFSVRFNF
ncbi:MAG: carboxypeptidase regulatory-like domain-containing protein [Blastocatellia bacterium]|nr:carboxypeptidase regulatory-like domain-containing protein [Blastocatellia bacterium]